LIHYRKIGWHFNYLSEISIALKVFHDLNPFPFFLVKDTYIKKYFPAVFDPLSQNMFVEISELEKL